MYNYTYIACIYREMQYMYKESYFAIRVDNELSIKVGDFGLSRDTYQTEYYKMSIATACPVKWMPPEMLRDGISTEKSDVVSYCVCMCLKIMCMAKYNIYYFAVIIIHKLHVLSFHFWLYQWAFGITSWEVFSIGESPYPGLENHNILKHLDQGLRLEQPCLCPSEM